MRATRLNHVSIHADDLDESVRFYSEVLGLEKIPTYTFAFPVQYFRLGDQQLHIFQRPTPAPQFHHIAVDVDDFEQAFERARELRIHDDSAFFSDVYELPDGAVQMYLRDPAGNLVEVNWPDVATLDHSRLPTFRRLADTVEQTADGLRSSLYLQLRERASAPGSDGR
ncbi:VOC family protein [Patulibacter defluvii]|uniref:VOC family protein n=1 Tax=Patulibacter defluvii TaxID=3095358 RepID=UPI002A7665CD|nr:VOC family protein [Patulibacter sp. DM4]